MCVFLLAVQCHVSTVPRFLLLLIPMKQIDTTPWSSFVLFRSACSTFCDPMTMRSNVVQYELRLSTDCSTIDLIAPVTTCSLVVTEESSSFETEESSRIRNEYNCVTEREKKLIASSSVRTSACRSVSESFPLATVRNTCGYDHVFHRFLVLSTEKRHAKLLYLRVP